MLIIEDRNLAQVNEMNDQFELIDQFDHSLHETDNYRFIVGSVFVSLH